MAEVPSSVPRASTKATAPKSSAATSRAKAQRAKAQRATSVPPEQLDLAVGSSNADVARLREHVRLSARNVPGVYLMRGAHGDVLYVGKSTQLRTRLLSYFRLPWPAHRHARMLRETASLEWEEQPSEFAALLREVRLIRAHLPRYNIKSARPLHRWWVITVSDGIAPRLRVQRASAAMRDRRQGHTGMVGPFSSRAPLVEALRVLNDALGLRDCPDRVRLMLRDAAELFDDVQYPQLARTPACHRYETRRCLGPCVGACSAGEYRAQLTRARAVLEGRDDTPQQTLVREMAVASAALSYERAGWLRDRLASLQELEVQLLRVREAVARPSGVYAVPGRDGDDRVYLIRHGRVIAEARCNDLVAMSALHARATSPDTTASGIAPDHLDEVMMIGQWFRTRQSTTDHIQRSVVDALSCLRDVVAEGSGRAEGTESEGEPR
ncbi:MAG: GIY-YIG nuclease family protein [Gemmatimonadaceae bacterium]|nr:GIY-YIG nuclease family protein [Gemmatimonadaceae bacterium]